MTAKSELDIIQPLDFVMVKGEKVFIKGFKFRKLNRFAQLAATMQVALMSALNKIEVDEKMDIAWNPNTLSAIAELMEKHTDEVIEAMCMFTDKEPEWFDSEKGPDAFEGITLLTAVIMKNLDFFTNTLLPMISNFRAMNSKKKAPGRK